MNTGTALVGQSLSATLVPLKADGTINTTAKLSSQSFSVSDSTVATAVTNADGTATLSAVGEGTVTVTASALVTDSDGTTQTLSATGTLTVGAATPPPTVDRTASLGIDFGTAQ